ncbi:DUF6412 domain-containing protein [Kitasatospora sp. NBC_01250]|uniref:DUF6412 domain-containing protein n=1 Tax=unclassified Kitasatospora TaxID=2633591 RepID=UPI002E11362D|nr:MULTISPECIES: DUF6412 domain-containing protein [unclassified Kitasatospora]WSJ67419.1 DUF6412 domain-containing protein [Kitasatospora sp. NBC_01302]
MHPLVLLLGLLRLLTGDLLPGGSSGLTALATAATLVVLAGVLSATFVLARLLGSRAPHAVRDGTLRRHALRTAFLPQRDPDARGRRRPRAPGAALAAA